MIGVWGLLSSQGVLIMKICDTCNRELPKFKRKYCSKECYKEHLKEYLKNYYSENKEYYREGYLKNRESRIEKAKLWNKNNPEKK